MSGPAIVVLVFDVYGASWPRMYKTPKEADRAYYMRHRERFRRKREIAKKNAAEEARERRITQLVEAALPNGHNPLPAEYVEAVGRTLIGSDMLPKPNGEDTHALTLEEVKAIHAPTDPLVMAIAETIVAAVPDTRARVVSLKGLLVHAAGGNVDREADVLTIRRLLDEGCDLEADILPTVARIVPKLPRPLRHWGEPWLAREILAAREQRLAEIAKTIVPAPVSLRQRLEEACQANYDARASVEPIQALLDQGCDLEADVLPTVARTVPEMPRPLKNWGAEWLVQEILAARVRRLVGPQRLWDEFTAGLEPAREPPEPLERPEPPAYATPELRAAVTFKEPDPFVALQPPPGPQLPVRVEAPVEAPPPARRLSAMDWDEFVAGHDFSDQPLRAPVLQRAR
jgi:hypothetical protein